MGGALQRKEREMHRSDSGWPVLWFGCGRLAGRVNGKSEMRQGLGGTAQGSAACAGWGPPGDRGGCSTGKREAAHCRWSHRSYSVRLQWTLLVWPAVGGLTGKVQGDQEQEGAIRDMGQ